MEKELPLGPNMSFGGVPPWAKTSGKDPRLERRRVLMVVSENRKVRLEGAEERQRERAAKAYSKAANDKIDAAHAPFTTAPPVEVRRSIETRPFPSRDGVIIAAARSRI